MSFSVDLTEPEKVKGIAVMSGRLLPGIKPFIVTKDRFHNVQIFVAHWIADPVLKYAYAEEAVAYLKSKSLKPEFHSSDESHTINEQMLYDINTWLSS